MKANTITKLITEYEYYLAKYKFIQEKFPNAKVHTTFSPVTFSSELVNSQYTDFKIIRRYSSLFIEAYMEVEFEYNGNSEFIIVYTSPRKIRLASVGYPKIKNKGVFSHYSKKRVIKFSRLKFNMKNNQIKEDCLNECYAAIMKFIGDNPGCDLDDKHLDPRLKKLIGFI